MKILYLHPSAWTGEYTLLKTIRDIGHTVCVLEEKSRLAGGPHHLSPFYLEPGDAISTLWHDPRRGLEKTLTWIVDRPFKRAFNGRNLAHRMWMIRVAYRLFTPDAVVCSEGFSYGIPASFLRQLRVLGVPLLVGYIGGDVLDCPQADVGKRRTPVTAWLIRRSVRGPDILRPVSPLVRERLMADGAPRDRIFLCPSHLVANRTLVQKILLRHDALRARLRDSYRIPRDAPLVVTLGGNQKGKGIHILAAAWSEILRHVPDCHWLLCGPDDAWLSEAVWQLLDEEARGRVHLTGQLTGQSVFEHLAAADLHVNPSLCESLNMVTVEAASVGIPTVCSDGAGIAHWVASHDAGSIVGAGDVAALASAVIAALRNEARLSRWSHNACDLVKEFYPDQIARRLLEVLGASGAPLGAAR